MGFLAKIKKGLSDLLADENKEPAKPRPKIPKKVTLTYPSNIRPCTKYIIESQASKSQEEFYNRVGECTKWINKELEFYSVFPLYRINPRMAPINIDVDEQETKYLIALRAALSKHHLYWEPIGRMLVEDIQYELNKRGHKYVLKTKKTK